MNELNLKTEIHQVRSTNVRAHCQCTFQIALPPTMTQMMTVALAGTFYQHCDSVSKLCTGCLRSRAITLSACQ